MKLSVIVVNYNVRHFLEQCLASVYQALEGIDGEIIVVDNASIDGSVEMLKNKFPNIKVIANINNVGFSKANNQAIKEAKGEYILLLNPDTLVQENTFRECIAFMDQHPDAGGLTVKMIDGKGKYLPESKRGFPSPWTAFCKIFGLTSLFPKSKTFASYYLGHLDKNSTHEIEILPGAFMFLRKTALDKVGLLDEDFFMYGEDIDLSYRIIQAGFRNYYYPACQIIHYKGESTKKGSLNYVLVFYKAMIIFAQKHIGKKSRKYFTSIIKFAVIVRATVSALKRLLVKIWLPLVDLLILILGAITIIPAWEQYRHGNVNVYPQDILHWLIGLYFTIWIFSLWLYGAYDKPQARKSAGKGILVGSLVILLIYSILPGHYRFSRAIIILLTLWTIAGAYLSRYLLSLFQEGIFKPNKKNKNIAFVGTDKELEKSAAILRNVGISENKVIRFYPNEIFDQNKQISTSILEDSILYNNVTEIIFGTQQIPMASIILLMISLSKHDVEFKIALHSGDSIVGSNSIQTTGELYTLDYMTLSSPMARRLKRLFDIIASLFLILFWIIIAPFLKKPFHVLSSAIKVLFYRKTWIGYNNSQSKLLPNIKPAVYSYGKHSSSSSENCNLLDSQYAKNYSIKIDLKELIKNLF